MYFNHNKENTNIDNEFKQKKIINFDFNKYKIPLIGIAALILLIIIIIIIISSINNKTEYFITLNGNSEMNIYNEAEYIEPGYKGFDNKGHDLTDKVEITGKVDSTNTGTYTITYSLHKTKLIRTVNVVPKPTIPTYIHLNGELNIYLNLGDTYTEPGYSAIDTDDGDITNNVVTTGTVDTSKLGTYTIIYSVVNSKGITTSETRTIIVK